MDVLGWIATVFTIGYFVANAAQMLTFVRSRSTGDATVLPFAATFANCMLWLKYGVYLADTAIISVNAFGAAMMLLTMASFWLFTAQRAAAEALVLAVLAPLSVIYALARFEVIMPQLVGSLAAVASVLMFASPLVTLGGIIRRRDSSVLSLPSMMCGLLLAVAWTAYGIKVWDANVVVPNALGALLSVVQLGVWFVFRNGAAPVAEPAAADKKSSANASPSASDIDRSAPKA